MAITPRLDIRQSQTLVLTPQLQQAIKMLQLSSAELVEYVAEEVDKNPLLDYGERSPNTAENETSNNPDKQSEDRISNNPSSNEEPTVKTADDFLQDASISNNQNEAPLDTEYSEFYDENSFSDNIGATPTQNLGLNGSNMITGGAGNFDYMESAAEINQTGVISLKTHLEDQLVLLDAQPYEKIIIQYLIGLMDEAGYITEDTDLIAQKVGSDVDDINRIFKIAQTMEPVGVFARNLSECLKLQQIHNDRYDPVMEIYLDNLQMMMDQKQQELRKLCNASKEDFLDMVEEVQALNPRPGLAYGEDAVYTVVPDVYVKKSPKGKWFVELNNDTLPKVLMNNRYLKEVSTQATNKEDKDYIDNCATQATWIIRALDQRAQTILKVSGELVRLQKNFLDKGIQFLAPINLKTIAEAIEMHESTVSRVTRNKYIATPRGIFEMKYFFTNAISSLNSDNQYSSKSIKYLIKQFIDKEDPKKILSDDKIVDLVRAEGIDLARRTVAKYRESLEIPSSIIRRRMKNPVL
ncbi:MAG: RNA polymerase factor sigma-54 [Kordiimonadaceae bacterium]|jgi:RNA polymerase sigma-54 factor|nr:RNA polymerase factor sigma-54 [Kordiimonadaceae bacterium]